MHKHWIDHQHHKFFKKRKKRKERESKEGNKDPEYTIRKKVISNTMHLKCEILSKRKS
jgi:hypothetical protein